MLGFAIRNDAAGRSELALASDPALFEPKNKAQRTQSNFYCNRATGGLALARGETMYIVPPEVLARFVGQEKLYFGLASSADSTPLRVDVRPGKDSPYISLRGLSARSMTRVRILPNRQQRASGYNGAGLEALEWAGDAPVPGMVSTAPANGATAPVNGAQPYDDGFGPLPVAAPVAAPSEATPTAQGMSAPYSKQARSSGFGGGSGTASGRKQPGYADAFDASGPSFELRYRMFIPSPLIDAPTAVFGGDGRSFSYDGGTSRGEITVRVRMTPGGGVAGVDLLNRHWGQSTEYRTADSHAVAGKPSWWLEANSGANPIREATLPASDDNLRVYVGAPGTVRSITAMAERASIVTIDASGGLPLSLVSPNIDAVMTLFIRLSGDGVEVRVDGEHDGFPCHELYVNGQRIYSYDPVAAGSSPTALMPPMDVTARTDWVSVGNATTQSLAAWRPAGRGMGGGADAAIAIGGFVLESVRDSVGDVTWELDQFAHIKHPNDVAPANPAAFRDAPPIRLNNWPVEGGLIDDISAWFMIEWQFNGRSLGNVRISNIGTNDAVAWGLHVRAQIMDDNILYQPGSCAALRVRFHYRFTRTVGADVLAVADVHLFGNGTTQQSRQLLQASLLAADEDVRMPAPPAPRARAMDGGVSAAIAIGGFILTSIRDSAGDVAWELDQFAHIKHPNDVAPTPAAPFRDAATIRLDAWPVSGGLIDDISAWFSIDWQFNGKSLGNVRISNIGTNDAVGWGLTVRAQIMDDNILYQPGSCAALRIRLHYRFTRSIGSDVLAVSDIHLYGDGTWDRTGQWIQSSTLALSAPAAVEPAQMPAPPAPRARAMDGGASVAIAIGGFIVESVRDSAGDVTWELDQFAHIKYPNDTAPSPAVAFRDANTIRLNRWPVSGGLIDDISAWFSIDWQFDGRSLGNVRISNIGTNDAVGWGLHVRAQIMDDNILYQPGQCAALRLRFHYRFSRSLGSDVIGVTDVHLYGDGTYEESSQWLQSSTFAMDAIGSPTAPGTMVSGSNAGVSWDLMQHPSMTAPASQLAATGRIAGEAISLADWPYLDEADGSRTRLVLDVAWDHDASGAVGAIRITPGASATAGGRSLAVFATIEEIEGTPSSAALQATIRYVFKHATEGEQVAVTTIKFHGTGKFVRDSEWQVNEALVTA